MRRVVELAAASLPWAIRDRYLEEWLHDLEHAAEAGVRRGDIAWGAVRTAITADRLQAPSVAHAILQARLRIDSAGMHAGIAMMLAILAHVSSPQQVAAIAAILATGAVLHSIVVVVQLQLAAATLGGMLRFAGLSWAVGAAVAAVAAGMAAVGADVAWWVWLVAASCCILCMTLAELRKPPKPEVVERVPPRDRRPLLLVSASLVAATVALALLDGVVLAPLLRTPGATLDAAWGTVGAAAGPSSPLAAAALLAGLLLVPAAAGVFGAARWARSRRGMLGWAAGGAMVAVIGAHAFATVLAGQLQPMHSTPGSVLLPLLAGALLHLTARAHRDLAPLPPASVPLPPGPWHVGLDTPRAGTRLERL